MLPKQTLLFLIFNILGFSLLVSSIYFYLNESIIYTAACGISGIILLVISFIIGLKPNQAVINSDRIIQHYEPEIVDESEDTILKTEIIPIVDLKIVDLPTESHNGLDLDIVKEYLSHYDFFEGQSSEKIIFTQVDSLEILDSNLLNIKDKMNTYGLIKNNPLYEYRLDLLLKNNLQNTKIWKELYEPIPYVTLRQQYLDLIDRNIYLVSVSLSNKNFIDIGYLPYSIRLDLDKITSIKATLIGGSYNFLNDEKASFENHESPLTIKLRIETT